MPITTGLGKRFSIHLSATNSDIPLEKVEALWQDIAMRYNKIPRSYHTLRHIQQLFDQFKQINQRLYEPHIIALALFFHDVIYDPSRPDNELKSAEYAVNKLSPYLSAEQCEHIYALIMMTASHQISETHKYPDNNKKDSDAAYLLDMDLSILGAPWAEYKKYAQAVRQEYAYVSNIDYRAGRTKVLTGLLMHSTLYLTDYYHKRLEVQARENIKREIKTLHAS